MAITMCRQCLIISPPVERWSSEYQHSVTLRQDGPVMIPAPCNPSGSTKMVSASRLAHARDQAGDREYPLRRYRYEVLRQDRQAALPRGSLRRMVRTWARADSGAG